MFSTVQRTSSVINTIVNHKCSYTKVIFLRLCKKLSYKTLGNRVWDKETLNVLQRFPERYKHFITCRQYSNEIHPDVLEAVISEAKYVPEHKVIHSMLRNSVHYENTIMPPVKRKVEVVYDEICQLYTVDWSCASASYVYDTIKKIAYCYLCGSRFEPTLFDSIFLACNKKLPELNDKQLMVMMQHLIVFSDELKRLNSWPPFLKTLDKECLKRFYPTSTEEMLLVIDVFYQLDAFETHYMWRAIRRLTSKTMKLSAKNLVQTLFYYSRCKNVPKANMFEIECRFQECLSDLSANEIAILARSFFMSRTRIKNKTIMTTMIKKVKSNIMTMDSVSLAPVMKIIRYSDSCNSQLEFKDLLASLRTEIPRLSLKCLTHIAHAFGGVRIYDEILTKRIVERVKNELNSARLKDIERVLFAIYSVAPHDSYYQDACQTLVNEVLLKYQTTRAAEIDTYPLSLVRIVTYATASGIYLPELIQHIMQPAFIQKIYKNNIRLLTNDLLTLHCSVKIEFPHYQDLLLSKQLYNGLIKKYLYTDDVHRKDNKLKLLTEIVFLCKNNLGLNVYVDYILPHYLMKDIIIGFDEHNKSIEVEPILSSMPEGSIKYVNNEELKRMKWKCLYVIPQTQMVIGRDGSSGVFYNKMKHLKLIGYTPIAILESVWSKLSDEEAKEQHLKNVIYENLSDA